MIRGAIFILILPMMCAAVGCEHRQSDLPVVTMRIGSKDFEIEIAATSAAQETGLMKRDSMPADHGMIFVFPDEIVRQFWMKNTRFPLDIIFIDSTGKVVSVHKMQAYDEHITTSDAPARFAIELNDGAAGGAGVKAGDQIIIPPRVLKP